MTENLLISNAEKQAEKAESLKAFSGLKLLHIKRQIEKILGLIGRDGIFDEYTKHDVSHIDRMLESLDWIIPQNTKEIMTPSDWLMITLSIYFHDLGMLVTRDEFSQRHKTSFPNYKKDVLDGNYGLDYKEKILSLGDEERQDRFIYQELVRRTHAERIRYWILAEVNQSFPNELAIVTEIRQLISHLDSLFKRDLALVCESHHLSDLDDFEKYKPNQQYGPSKDEKVNLHYAALLLRTADLLHVTSDRTPSIEFKLINPNDPISQEEWAKQRAVKAVRPQLRKNKEGVADNSLLPDTLEIIAFFENEEGFFGLISYLNYVNKQLKENFKYNENINKQFGINYEYPWRNIDDSSIEAKDFEKRQFEFVLDQTRILNLLVGHTLYNDSSVVLRELTQNGIDAVKLKKHELELENVSNYIPEINISWNDKLRELSFTDNGTGMTLEIVQNHLLKVGSSRYQDEGFKKKFPGFSPISRFGIGLLTCFLIADDLDIITKSNESDKAIMLKIKKVHGKYLLKYLTLDKIRDVIANHGTQIKLYVRADVNLQNIELELKKWVLIPSCKLTLQLNEEKVKEVGYSNARDLLRHSLQERGFDVDGKNLKINEVQRAGVTLAFAVRYVEHWNEWDFLEYTEANHLEASSIPVGTCIEGIRVDFNTPGFVGRNLYAVANASGKNAPKTNVARSNIEITPEREILLYTIYQLYLDHISTELSVLRKKGFSITWAASEATWLLNSFTKNSRNQERGEHPIEDIKSFNNALMQIDSVLIERMGNRELISFNALKDLGHFWSIDCASYFSADSLIKEVKSSNSSALSLLKTIFETEDSNTEYVDYLFCKQRSYKIIDNLINLNFQVDTIKIIPEQRRLDLRWSIKKTKIWEEIELFDDEYSRTDLPRCYIQLLDIDIDKNIKEIAINSSDALFILKNSELNEYLRKLHSELSNKTVEDEIALVRVVSLIKGLFNNKNINKTKIEDYIDFRLERNSHRDIEHIVWTRVNKSELISIILKTEFIKYDTTIWSRRELY